MGPDRSLAGPATYTPDGAADADEHDLAAEVHRSTGG